MAKRDLSRIVAASAAAELRPLEPRGLAGLLPRTPGTPLQGARMLPIELVEPNPEQPRQVFDERSLTRLTQSIKQHGVLEPVIVHASEGRYLLVAGERRRRAAEMAGLTEIPVVIRDDLEESDLLTLAMIENLHRDNMELEDRARGLANLQEQTGWSDREMARQIGRSKTWVNYHLGLARRRPELFERIRSGEITYKQAREMLGVSGPISDEVSPGGTLERATLDKKSGKRGPESTPRGIQPLPWRRRAFDNSFSVFENTDWRRVPDKEREDVLTRLTMLEEHILRAKQALVTSADRNTDADA